MWRGDQLTGTDSRLYVGAAATYQWEKFGGQMNPLAELSRVYGTLVFGPDGRSKMALKAVGTLKLYGKNGLEFGTMVK